MPDVIGGKLHYGVDVVAKEMIAIFSDLKENLIYLLRVVCIEKREDVLEYLIAAVYIFKCISQKADTFPQSIQRYLNNIARFLHAKQETSQNLLTAIVRDAGFSKFEFLANKSKRSN